ncbi:MAG: hypothetical protein NDI63_11890 [Pseudobdellovibrio sp.]|nr:hypothetical protein [Pseudobdellovibrio sp.]
MKALLVAFFILASSCANKEKFEYSLLAEKCEESLRDAPQNLSEYKLVSETQYAAGTLLSYSATGAAYTADVAIFISTVVGLAYTVCILPLAAEGSFHGSRLTEACIRKAMKKYNINPEPQFGYLTYKATEPFRCPRVDLFSQAIRKVASCYLKKGGPENNEKALRALQSIKNSEPFYRCLTPPEREIFSQEFDAIQKLNQKTTFL